MSVRRSIAWGFLGQFLSAAVAFAGSVVLARLLSPREFGVYAIAIATIGVIQVIAAFGVSSYVVREPELTPQALDTAFTLNALLSVALSGLIVVTSYGGGRWLGDPGVASVMQVVALFPLFGIFTFRISVMLQRDMRFKAIALIGLASITLGTTLTIAAALAGYSYMSLAIGGIGASLVGLTGHIAVGRRFFSLRTSFTGGRAVIIFGLQMMSISGLAVLTARLSDVILGGILGLAALGLYARASGLSAAIFENVYGAVTRVLFVKMSRDYHQTGSLSETYLRALRILTAVMWPLVAGVGILSRPVIQLLYGPRWLDAALPLALLMVWQIVAFGFAMNWELFVLRRETARQTKIEAIRSVTGLGFFTLGSMFGIAGAAVGRIMDVTVGLILYYPHLSRLAGTNSNEIPRALAGSALLTVAAVTPAMMLMVAENWSERTPPGYIGLAVLSGIGLWFALLVKQRHPLLDEFRQIAAGVPLLRRLGWSHA